MKSICLKISIIAFLLLLILVTCIHPIYPKEQFLQHLGTVLMLIIPISDLKRNRLSNSSFVCVSLFIMIHIIGARYIYSTVPYNDWFKSAFNLDLNALFHTTRNHYDRYVHLMFGILAFPYLYEIAGSGTGMKKIRRILMAFAVIQSISMFYEIFEWLLTIVLSSESADNYNGQQGDMWDAQKDMALALTGSLLMATVYAFRKGKAE